jgi:hypothetical protein
MIERVRISANLEEASFTAVHTFPSRFDGVHSLIGE